MALVEKVPREWGTIPNTRSVIQRLLSNGFFNRCHHSGSRKTFVRLDRISLSRYLNTGSHRSYCNCTVHPARYRKPIPGSLTLSRLRQWLVSDICSNGVKQTKQKRLALRVFPFGRCRYPKFLFVSYPNNMVLVPRCVFLAVSHFGSDR